MTSPSRLSLSTLVALTLALVLALPATAAVDPVGEWPLEPPEVVAGFDPPETTWGAGHRGVDLAGRPGQPVRTALAGRIAFVGTIAGRPVVTVSHGDTRTTYEPVTTSLPRGTRVAAGSVIGSLGVTGSHCFPAACLHWGWLRGETYLDPLRLVGGGPVRLLPLEGLGPAPGDLGSQTALPRTSPYAGWVPPATGLRLWP
ncbi:M23 family metallopeptidase [Nocardioides sp. GXQ0305]|uniref:M23 family metallopeptidase n=1 Tax=Nocardioides sp. GXQ0305 TaxID=3423912 RepID=UPI003D7CAB4C